MGSDSSPRTPRLHAALLDFMRQPGLHAVATRQPAQLFSAMREVLNIAAGRDSAGADVQSAACFFVRAALFQAGADHYTVMGLPRDVEATELKDRYRQLMRLTHPDFTAAGQSPWPADAAVRVNLAYETLSSPVSRREYDEQLASATRAHTSQPTPLRPAPVVPPRPAPVKPGISRERFRTVVIGSTVGVVGLIGASLMLGGANEPVHLIQRPGHDTPTAETVAPQPQGTSGERVATSTRPPTEPPSLAPPDPAAEASPTVATAQARLESDATVRNTPSPATPAVAVASQRTGLPETRVALASPPAPPANAVATRETARATERPTERPVDRPAPTVARAADTARPANAPAESTTRAPTPLRTPAVNAPGTAAQGVAAAAPAFTPPAAAPARAADMPTATPPPVVAAPAAAPTAPPAQAPVMAAVAPPPPAPVAAPTSSGTAPTLDEARPVLAHLLDQIATGRGDMVLRALDAAARNSKDARSFARLIDDIAAPPRSLRFPQAAVRIAPRGARLVATGDLRFQLTGPDGASTGHSVPIEAELEFRDGRVVLISLRGGAL